MWAALPLDERIAYLRSLLAATYRAAPGLVADTCAAKGWGSLQAGEEWVATVISMLSTMRILLDTLEGIRRTGRVPLPESAVAVRPDGQVTLRVVPTFAYDRLIFPGVSARVWVEPEVARADLEANLGSFYTKGTTPSGRGVPGAGGGERGGHHRPRRGPQAVRGRQHGPPQVQPGQRVHGAALRARRSPTSSPPASCARCTAAAPTTATTW